MSSEAKPSEKVERGIEFSVRIRGGSFPRRKRASAVIRKIKEAASSMVEEERIVISPQLSELIWRRGIEKPPRILKLKIEVNKDDGVATVLPIGVDRSD